MRRPARALALVAAAALLAGCGEKSEPVEGPAALVYPLVVDDARGRSVTLSESPERIVSLDAGAAATLRQLGRQPIELGADAPAADVRAARPDLVVLPATEPGADALQRRLGVPVFVMGGGRLRSVEHSTLELGLAAGRPVGGRELASSLRDRRRRVAQQVAQRPAVPVFVDTGLGFPPNRNSLLAALVRVAGGRLLGLEGEQPVSPARLRELDPAAIIATTTSGVTLEALRRRPATAKLRAVREGRVLVVSDADLVAGSRAYAALERIATFLHGRGT